MTVERAAVYAAYGPPPQIVINLKENAKQITRKNAKQIQEKETNEN